MTFRHSTGLFAYTTGVNGICQRQGLHWLLDFIAAQQKRTKKHTRFKDGQRWVHKVLFRRATVYCYPVDSDDDPLIFPQKLYTDVTEPVITLYLEEGVLQTEEERDAPV
jgi:hypothetical protein